MNVYGGRAGEVGSQMVRLSAQIPAGKSYFLMALWGHKSIKMEFSSRVRHF